MDLVFEVSTATQSTSAVVHKKNFKQAGGVIGREESCDWVLPDRKRYLSKRHAMITYSEGVFFLTDVSRNGTRDGRSGAQLPRGKPVRIEHGSMYVLGEFEIRAQLIQHAPAFEFTASVPQRAGSVIPDDAFFSPDPLETLNSQEHGHSELDDLLRFSMSAQDTGAAVNFSRIDREHLRVPQLIASTVNDPDENTSAVTEVGNEAFWEQFASALGLSIENLDVRQRESLAVSVAELLRLSISGLRQSLRTRAEIKNELGLARTLEEGVLKNPLKCAAGTPEVLHSLLQTQKPGQLSAQQSVSSAFHELQAQQVALVAAGRAAVSSTLGHFSPQQLSQRIQRHALPFALIHGSRWRAYERYYEALQKDGDWCEHLLARDFTRAYEEQLRLISTLQLDQEEHV